MFDEWMTHPDLYQHFLTGERIFETEAKLFLNNGHFATDLGNAMPLAMASALKLPKNSLLLFSQSWKICQFYANNFWSWKLILKDRHFNDTNIARCM